ncbi:MAG: copper-containing nitrite reductase [Thermomicrobiales bacterium]
MAIETRPRRPIEDIGNVDADDLPPHASTSADYDWQPPKVVTPIGGPSWREFLFTQIALVLGVALLFGSIAYALVSHARPTTSAANSMPGMDMSGMAGMSSTTPVDYAHGAAPAPAAAGSVPRLPLPQVAPPVGQREATTVKVTIEVKEVVATLDDGITYTYWTFNGTVPGPMIRVREGDTVELTLKNPAENKVAHNIDLHAVNGPGGGADASMVQPGESKTFSFKAQHAGVFVYHCAMAPVPQHISSGMFGMIVVEPPQGLPKVDREFYVMQSDMYLQGPRDQKGLRTFSNDKMMAEQPDYVVFNGSAGALTGDNALKAKTGETVRIFFGVGGPNITSSFHIIGTSFDRVAQEGASLDDPSKWATNVQTTLVPAGGATMVEFKTEVPGKYTLVDHSLGRVAKGAAAILQVEGPENPDIFKPAP